LSAFAPFVVDIAEALGPTARIWFAYPSKLSSNTKIFCIYQTAEGQKMKLSYAQVVMTVVLTFSQASANTQEEANNISPR
jgi:hypothetical protein